MTSRETRDHAMLAMLIGCGLRRSELLGLTLASLQQREDKLIAARPSAWLGRTPVAGQGERRVLSVMIDAEV
jgi:site-specific recombinase XerD